MKRQQVYICNMWKAHFIVILYLGNGIVIFFNYPLLNIHCVHLFIQTECLSKPKTQYEANYVLDLLFLLSLTLSLSQQCWGYRVLKLESSVLHTCKVLNQLSYTPSPTLFYSTADCYSWYFSIFSLSFQRKFVEFNEFIKISLLWFAKSGVSFIKPVLLAFGRKLFVYIK